MLLWTIAFAFAFAAFGFEIAIAIPFGFAFAFAFAFRRENTCTLNRLHLLLWAVVPRVAVIGDVVDDGDVSGAGVGDGEAEGVGEGDGVAFTVVGLDLARKMLMPGMRCSRRAACHRLVAMLQIDHFSFCRQVRTAVRK